MRAAPARAADSATPHGSGRGAASAVTAATAQRYARAMSRIDDPCEFQRLSRRLVQLREEHRDMDAAIIALQATQGDELSIRRLKKRKLQLKDQIQWMEDALVPDEPA